MDFDTPSVHVVSYTYDKKLRTQYIKKFGDTFLGC